ncbi:MAG: class I SAM-dependent methyltransferase [Terracidiphilus sp.]
MTESLELRRKSFLDGLFEGYRGPAFAVRLWDGWRWACSGNGAPVCTIVAENPKALAALLAAPNENTLGEAFIQGSLDVEGDIFSVFSAAEHLFNGPRPLHRRIAERLASQLFGIGQRMRHGRVNSRRRDRASIAYHYDQPVSFFEPWLGRSLVYSCAYFRSPREPLDQAQEQKLDLVCRKLRLQPGERFLDIGCGWGSLLLHAAGAFGAEAHGITLSREQAATVQRRIRLAELERNCFAELCDYRELDGSLQPSRPTPSAGSGQALFAKDAKRMGRQPFDKIASIGMAEHVGLRNLPLYFRIARGLLRPGGIFLNHAIARSPLSPIRHNSFVGRYVFPDGQLVTLSEMLTAAGSQGLEVRDVENLREHYELTLRCWVEGLRKNESALLSQVSRTTYRIWLLYMAGAAAAFRRGDIAIYQTVLSRPDRGSSRMPLTREDIYEDDRDENVPGKLEPEKLEMERSNGKSVLETSRQG